MLPIEGDIYENNSLKNPWNKTYWNLSTNLLLTLSTSLYQPFTALLRSIGPKIGKKYHVFSKLFYYVVCKYTYLKKKLEITFIKIWSFIDILSDAESRNTTNCIMPKITLIGPPKIKDWRNWFVYLIHGIQQPISKLRILW